MMRFFLFVSVICFTRLWGQTGNISNLPYGKYEVGFKMDSISTGAGKMRIYIWYPANEKRQNKLRLREYLQYNDPGNSEENAVSDFMSGLQRMYRYTASRDIVQSKLSIAMKASYGSAIAKGKFPLLIALAEPYSYCLSFEYLASHGKVVAIINPVFKDDPPSPDGPNHYTRYTDVMEDLLNFMLPQNYINPSDISVFGHGFGINPALYLAMRRKEIKKSINFDGGFFGPRSKTTLSGDYKPALLKASLFYVVTQQQSGEDDAGQIRSLHNPIYSGRILTPNFDHMDFTLEGRYFLSTLNPADPQVTLINKVYLAIHANTLLYLNGQDLVSDEHFRVEPVKK